MNRAPEVRTGLYGRMPPPLQPIAISGLPSPFTSLIRTSVQLDDTYCECQSGALALYGSPTEPECRKIDHSERGPEPVAKARSGRRSAFKSCTANAVSILLVLMKVGVTPPKGSEVPLLR